MIFSAESLNWWMDLQVVITCKCERILPHIIPEFNVFLHIKVSSVHPQKYQPSTTSSETANVWSTKGCHYCHLPPGDSHPYCGCHESQGAIFFGNVLDRSISLYNEANIRCLVHLEWTFTPNKTNGWIYTQNDMGRLEKRWVGKSTAGLFERWPVFGIEKCWISGVYLWNCGFSNLAGRKATEFKHHKSHELH